jgi:hypothetical protein
LHCSALLSTLFSLSISTPTHTLTIRSTAACLPAYLRVHVTH